MWLLIHKCCTLHLQTCDNYQMHRKCFYKSDGNVDLTTTYLNHGSQKLRLYNALVLNAMKSHGYVPDGAIELYRRVG